MDIEYSTMMKPFSGNPQADDITALPLKKIGACEFGPEP